MLYALTRSTNATNDGKSSDRVDTTEGAVMVEVVMEEIALPACWGEHLNSHGGVLK